jgi:hypothetical protein
MASEYRPDRRIDAIRPLSAVTKNEATEATDLRRDKAVEAERERLADELRRGAPKRSFAELIKKKP